VRDLHGEGLSSEVVRRRLSEEAGSGRLEEKLSEISASLEELRSSSADYSGEAMRVIMARQNLLISAVFNLTGMVEELLEANGRVRRASPGRGEENGSVSFPEEGVETILSRSEGRGVRYTPDGKFGLYAKRRRKGAMVVLVLAVLLIGIAVLQGLN
jgi:hypothetical protein